ncbi:MAG: hypothetical protein LHV69_06080 [Elusimicrobia bacterium]|nr:hypothetical protein [Candidatus Obscuribacterium magneticum]
MKQQYIEEKLENQGLTLFTSQEFRRAGGLTPASAKQLLIRYVKKGILLKLKEKRGLYCLKRKTPHPWLLANKLLQPSYISLETALAHYGVLPESVYAVTSVTPLVTRTFESLHLVFTYQKIKRDAYLGYCPMDVQGTTVWMAEPEKAVADYLYFSHLGRKPLNNRLRWSMINRKKLFQFLKVFQRKGLLEWGKNVVSIDD